MKRSHSLSLLPLALLLPVACTPAPPASAPAAVSAAPATAVDPAMAAENTRALSGWLDEVFQSELARSPQAQAQFGMIGDLDAYGRWDDPSGAAALASRERQR